MVKAFKHFQSKLKVAAYREAVFIIALTIVLLVLGPTIHWSKYYTHILYKYRAYALDESAMTFTIISFFLVLYGVKRNNEKKKIIEEQKNIEADLQSTQDNLNALVTSSASILFNCEACGDMKSLYVSDNITSILGYPKEKFFIEKWWRDNIHADDEPHVMSELSILFVSGKSIFDYRFKHKNGSWVWMRTDCKLINDNNGKPAQIVGTWWDISEEIKNKELIRQNNERIQLAFKASRDTIYDWDLVTNDIWMSEEVYNTYGYIKDTTEITILWWESKIHPEDHDAIFADVMKAIEQKKTSWSGEYRFQCGDGSYKNVFDRGFILYSSEGTPLRWIGSMSDITKQKATEQLLATANERFELASNASTDTIYDRNLITNEIWMSDDIFRSFGYSHYSHVELECWEHKIHPDDHHKIIQSVKEAKKRKEKTWRQNYRLRKADGTYAHISDRRQILYNNEGTPVRSIGSMTDITILKETEAALILAKEKAEESVKFKSEFLANMSHEIRTPLNGIIGMTELTLESNIDTQQKRYLDNIKFSSKTLLSLINDILDFSKIDAGKLELSPINFSLRDEIPKALQGISLKASEKKIELIFCLPQNVPDLFFGDVFRLQQVIVNLAGNAIKFTDKGEVAIRCKLKSIDQNEAMVQFSITDTGIGISEGKIASIFDEFSQADGSVSRQYGGTGLGLAISKKLVKLMGGTIWAESKPGIGSTFNFTICMQLQDVKMEPRFVPGTALDGKKVLIIEDNKVTREYTLEVVTQFRMKGCAVASGENGLFELNKAVQQKEPFDLVLLDIHLATPMDGFDVVTEMKKNPALKSTEVIVISMSQKASDRERFALLGINHFFSKPYSQSDLLDSIQNIFLASDRIHENGQLRERIIIEPKEEAGPLKILLVEDNIINQEVAFGMLTRLGHSITIANNGLEAVEAIQQKSFDIILMDVQMPKMNGYDATLKIREIEKQTGKHHHIIGLTANAMKGDREKCLEIGMDDYVSKPIRIGDITKAIARFLGKEETDTITTTQTIKKEKPLIDLNALFENLDSDEEIFDQFLFKIPAHLLTAYETLEEAVNTKISEDIVVASHTLRGLCLHFDMYKVIGITHEIEKLVSDNKNGEVATQLPTLKHELMKALVWIKNREGFMTETYRDY